MELEHIVTRENDFKSPSKLFIFRVNLKSWTVHRCRFLRGFCCWSHLVIVAFRLFSRCFPMKIKSRKLTHLGFWYLFKGQIVKETWLKKEAHIEMVQEKKRERRRREVGYGRDLDILKNNLLPKRFIKRDVMCRRLYCCARQQLFLHHSALKKNGT